MNKHLTCRRAFTLIELLIVIVIIAILISLLIPTGIGTLNQARITACRNNLKRLHECVHLYQARYGGPQMYPPTRTGSALWVSLTTPPTDVLGDEQKGAQHDLLHCPVNGNPNLTLGDYRGPELPWAGQVKKYRYVGGDRPDNHPDGEGNALRRDGGVDPISSPTWPAVPGLMD